MAIESIGCHTDLSNVLPDLVRNTKRKYYTHQSLTNTQNRTWNKCFAIEMWSLICTGSAHLPNKCRARHHRDALSIKSIYAKSFSPRLHTIPLWKSFASHCAPKKRKFIQIKIHTKNSGYTTHTHIQNIYYTLFGSHKILAIHFRSLRAREAEKKNFVD